MRISVVNFDESLTTPELLAGIRAVNVQIERDFAPYWHMHGQLRLDSADPRQSIEQLSGLRGDAIIYIVSRADPGHLGLHSRHANGTPFGFVFHRREEAGGQLPDALPWTVALSHEALELIADPECNLFCKGPHPDPAEGGREVLHWFEVCDPVQDESYEIDGIELSNFVLPLYFTGGEELDGRNDFLATRRPCGAKLRSFSANPGGYVGYHDPLLPGRSQLWFADDCAERSWARKCERLPRVFRRADRRDKPHPLQVSEPEAEAVVTPSVGISVAAIHLRLLDPDAELHDELEQLLAATLESADYMIRRSEFERRDVEVFGPAIERRAVAAAWDLAARLEAAQQPWLDYAEPVIVDHFAEAAAPEVRAAGRVFKACACDRDIDDPATEPGAWALERAGIPGAWAKFQDQGIARERAGEGVLIGHPDTGYTDYLKHAGRIAGGGHDFLSRNSDGRDPLSPLTLHPGHGTRTGSVIVGPRDGVPGLCGVAPGAKLVPYRITTSVILGRGDLLADALHAAVNRGCHVVSMSVGTALHPRRLQNAIARAHAANVILVAAAGNCVNRLGRDDGYVVFPARNYRCIACAAVDHAGQLWCGSSNAGTVDVYAPGKSVWCVEPERRGGAVAQRRRGTSFATAIVAGTAALWLHWHGRASLLEHCDGEVRLGDLFRATLSLCGRDPSFPDRHAKMLDAKAVLEVEPKAAAALAREDAASFLERALERLRGLFPRLPDEDFDGRLASVLGIDLGALLDVASEHEAELELLLAHDHDVRAAMLGLERDDEPRAATRGAVAQRLPVSDRLRARLEAARD